MNISFFFPITAQNQIKSWDHNSSLSFGACILKNKKFRGALLCKVSLSHKKGKPNINVALTQDYPWRRKQIARRWICSLEKNITVALDAMLKMKQLSLVLGGFQTSSSW